MRCLAVLLGIKLADTDRNFAAEFDTLDAADQADIAAIMQAAAARTRADEDAGAALVHRHGQ